MKKAIITGITGQDGSYLAEQLLKKGYEVHGLLRRSSSIGTHRIFHLFQNKKIYEKQFFLHYGDITDSICIQKIIKKIKPDEIYNLAAQSHVKVSFEIPEITAQVDAIGSLKIIESIINLDLIQKTKFYQASTSELYGKVLEIPQSETTPFYPRSPYGIAKQYAFWIIKNYREAYQTFAVNGILFNHESERRGFNFVTRKITLGLSRIKQNLQKKLVLGNIDSKRDWGYAPEYTEAMWMMLQQKVPEDFVIATGESHSIREFIKEAASHLDMQIVWKGKNENEVGIDQKTGKEIICIDPKYYRPTEVDILVGDSSKAEKKLGWKAKVKFKELIKIMIKHDYDYVKKNNGYLLF